MRQRLLAAAERLVDDGVSFTELSVERQLGMYLQSQGLAVQLVSLQDGRDSALVFDFAAEASTPAFRMSINSKAHSG